jgi:hypothetical protein
MRFPLSVGLALVGHLTFVNLVGKLIENGRTAALIYCAINIVLCGLIYLKKKFPLSLAYIWRRKRSWLAIVLVAIIFALPQWFQAASTNRWDETASSSTHITSPNQFAEGVYPPRHNAFPDIVTKYHYGFTVLSGTVRWLTGFSSNKSIDIVSTALWLFAFLFTYAWIRQMGLTKTASVWGGFSVLLGSGLTWFYLPWVRAYEGWKKIPEESGLIYSFNPESGWWENLVSVMEHQSIYLTNKSGELFNLPIDIGIHYQQHAIALGISLTLVSGFVFWLWQSGKRANPALFVINIFCFGLLFLGHAVFGGVAAVSAGLILGFSWLREPTRKQFARGLLFTLGVTVIAFAHGGMLARGDEYGGGAPLALRDQLGFISGTLLDQMNWLLASFGILLVFSLLSVWAWIRFSSSEYSRNLFLVFFGLFALVSFGFPQFLFFSHGGGLEEQTEITKFFYCTRFGLAMVSVLFVDWFVRRTTWWLVVPAFAMAAVNPIAASVAAVLDSEGNWIGFYSSPYDWRGGADYKASGESLAELKTSPMDQYYDLSMQEPESGYMGELLVHGGSAFTLSPTRYEVNGSGFLIAEDQVKDRILHESRVARLLPGAIESSGTDWIYTVDQLSLSTRPAIVRSRFSRLVSDGMLKLRADHGGRQLYQSIKSTESVDIGLENFWSPRIISQAQNDINGDGEIDLVFFHLQQKRVFDLSNTFSLNVSVESSQDVQMVNLVRFPGRQKTDIAVGLFSDGVYSRGTTSDTMARAYPIYWQRLDIEQKSQNQNYQFGSWSLPVEIPLFADLDGDGTDSRIIYNTKSGNWLLYPNRVLDGPRLARNSGPLPIAGRFFPESTGDLGLWSPVNGQFLLKSPGTDRTESFNWGGREGDILVPGDYDGDGYDELGIWQPHSQTWWIRDMESGNNVSYVFGTETGIPLPADYDNDGRLDLAYWEPKQQVIHVSFDFGDSTGRTIAVPPGSVPVFVHMY